MSEIRDDSLSAAVADAAERLFAGQVDAALLDAAERGEFPRALWQAIEEAGLPRMLVGEGQGGSGLSVADFATVARLAGRAGAPVPLVETIVAQHLLAEAGADLKHGPHALSIHGVNARWALAGEGEARLSGEDGALASARDAVRFVIVLPEAIAVAPPSAFQIEPGKNIAGEPRDRCRAEAAAVMRLPSARLDRALNLAALGRAALCVGACERSLELAVRYVSDRKQFGKPLAKFQAIQQQLAEMATAVAAAATITQAAAVHIDGAQGELLVAAARARTADAIDRCTAIAHQVQGAMGFSREYPLHHFSRRFWAWRDEAAPAVYWRRKLGGALAGTQADALWPRLAAIGQGAK